ncbi:MAG: Orotidine 5'-phosphate decarboxylase [Chlamydiales bacterium]|nr:Orotidine 5'-phosphate decarboxylase [Chlamydiales bacterium]MCH9636188.1 Orotidine 5'-phosphate decarboxylase [Chlamydiales bacterium]MCH9704106.1 orotidine-5'-phosphate decarboxylase [Chlamydiota bacterium]
MPSYSERAKSCLNPAGAKLLRLLDEKKSNLCLSCDVTTSKELLELADRLGPEICLLKTHIDIIEDFTPDLTHRLQELADKHGFMLFEDRKFADIGNTVRLQYGSGIYRISDWADITNAHLTPGPGVIEGLKRVGLEKGRGLLLLAQMSSAGALTHPEIAVQWAQEHAEFVIGFIATSRLCDDFIHMTPGVQLKEGTDALGQRYLTPQEVIGKRGSDIIIVGRAIYQAEDPLSAAKAFRELAFDAYQVKT